jgi:hypothetical protein
VARSTLDTLTPEARTWADAILKAHPELTEAGRVLVIEAARCREAIAEAERSLAESGYFVDGLHGKKTNPAESVARNNRAQLLKLLIALNLQDPEDEEE